ncbi:NAD kinase [Clostridia bacterium]|nr:NAD kinase [Clostridia bacterium]
MQILIIVNHEKEKGGYVGNLTANKLTSLGIEHFFIGENESALPRCDVIITIGGDGTILRWGKRAAEAGIPLLGINTGNLGFMSSLEPDELRKLELLKNGTYSISRRMMLDVSVRSGEDIVFFENKTVLNDIVFTKQNNSRLPNFSVRKNNITAAEVRADGVIFSTATGSTAYSLSAGGPVAEPEAECVIFTPICPHSLTSRPMIFGAKSDSASEIEVDISSNTGNGAYLYTDGEERVLIPEKSTAVIRKSRFHLDLVNIGAANNFYNVLREKLS